MLPKLVAFDGLSAAGKTTACTLLAECCLQLDIPHVVISENRLDPHRETTAALRQMLGTGLSYAVHKLLDMETFSVSHDILREAYGYACAAAPLNSKAQTERALAWMFARGRQSVQENYVYRALLDDKLVIADRWSFTGCAYQSTAGYRPPQIYKLNHDHLSIRLPDVQFVLSCPAADIPVRREYRAKRAVGTSGLMSVGREAEIMRALKQTAPLFRQEGVGVRFLETTGPPTPDISQQIQQFLPTFLQIIRFLQRHHVLPKDLYGDEEKFCLEAEQLEAIERARTNQ